MEDQYLTPPPVSPLDESPAQAPTDDIPPLKPSNWLWQSILATLFCCIVFGVVGIVYAARVDSLYFNGRYDEAEQAAKKAKMWTLIAVVTGLVYIAVWVSLLLSGNLPEYMENFIENNASGYNF